MWDHPSLRRELQAALDLGWSWFEVSAQLHYCKAEHLLGEAGAESTIIFCSQNIGQFLAEASSGGA